MEPASIIAVRKADDLTAFVESGRYKTELYGTAWGHTDDNPDYQRIKMTWLMDVIMPHFTVLEIGPGGGRWSQNLIDKVAKAILVDGTPASEIAIRYRFNWDGFSYRVSPDGTMPFVDSGSIDYCFSFDTFVHFEPLLFDTYVGEIGRSLRPGGKFRLHYARHWPENESPDPADFTYRDEGDIAKLLDDAGMSLTPKRYEQRSGNGSLFVEAVKR